MKQVKKDGQIIYIKKIVELITLLKELNIDIPIYDYSRRTEKEAHEINKEKFLNMTKKLDIK